MRNLIVICVVAVMAAACGDEGTGGADEFVASWSHTFPAITVQPGIEKDFDCQAVTLNNDEPLYVTAVRQYNDGAWHHSNWFHVPEDKFGEDGTFDCRDERFDMIAAATQGGVVFAQSTQTLEEVTRFPEGAVVVIPPRSKIIGAIHLVNLTAADINTTLTMELETTTDPSAIHTQLQPLSFLIYSLAIPPGQQSRWQMNCDMRNVYQNLEALNPESRFGIYYVMGHYHSWGNYFALSYVREDGTEVPIVEHDNIAGDTLGQIVDPPVFADDTVGLKVTCGYNNNTDRTLVWGNNGEDEMCMFLAYVGAPVKVVSWGDGEAQPMGKVNGMDTFEAACEDLIGLPTTEFQP